jgi:hypothetical protein
MERVGVTLGVGATFMMGEEVVGRDLQRFTIKVELEGVRGASRARRR